MATESTEGALAETLAAVVEASPAPLTTSEVADAVDCTRRTAYDRLDRLADCGALETKKVGARGRVWWSQSPDCGPTDGRDGPGGAVVEAMDDGVFVLDGDGRFVTVNGAYAAMTGADRAELVGAHLSTVLDEEAVERVRESRAELAAGERDAAVVEADLRQAAGESVPVEVTLTPMADGDECRWVGVVRSGDGPGRYERIVENLPVGVFRNELGPDGGLVEANPASASIVDAASVEALMGEEVAEFYPDPDRQAAFARRLEREGVIRDVQLRRETLDGEPVWLSVTAVETEEDGDRYVDGVVREVTHRVERESELERARARMELAMEVTDGAVWEWDASTGAVTVHPSVPSLFDAELRTHEDFLDQIHPEDRPTVERTVHDALETGEPYDVEFRVDLDDGVRWLIDSGKVFGDDPKRLIGVTKDITEQVERERELERQRERLAALNHLNEVVREINDAVVDQSTREEIERTVCEALADSDSYEFAWIADVDPETQATRPQVAAGLDDARAGADPLATSDVPAGRGPASRAARTGEMQVVRDTLEAPALEPWCEFATACGFRSFAAIPVTHEGTRYGVLGVYSARVEAFADEERAVVGQLGETVGHAIAAVERKQALMSDDVVEVEFRLQDLCEHLGAPTNPDGRVTFDRSVPVGDGTYLLYGTVTGEAADALRSVAQRRAQWERLTIRGRAYGEARFELLLSEEPMLSVVASHGGRVERAVIEDGDFQMRIHLPPSVDVRTVTDAVQEVNPATELVSRRQVTAPDDAGERLGQVLETELTGRQRAALEAAYYSGYFEWPRESSGEEVADALDVSASTFHQHLRFAHKQLLETLFD